MAQKLTPLQYQKGQQKIQQLLLQILLITKSASIHLLRNITTDKPTYLSYAKILEEGSNRNNEQKTAKYSTK